MNIKILFTFTYIWDILMDEESAFIIIFVFFPV